VKIDLIIFPMHDWKKGEEESFRTRDGHLMKAFEKSARTGKILVINRPTSLPEMVLKKKSWKVKNVLSSRKIGFFSRLGKVANKNLCSGYIFTPYIITCFYGKGLVAFYLYPQVNSFYSKKSYERTGYGISNPVPMDPDGNTGDRTIRGKINCFRRH